MKIITNKGKSNREHGLTLTCWLQKKYQKNNKTKSASLTIHTELEPKEIIEIIKKLLINFHA